MDAWKLVFTGGAPKMRAVAQSDRQPGLLQIVAKLSLKSAQELRLVRSMAYVTFNTRADTAIAEAVDAATKQAENTRGKPGHKEGAPDGHALVAIVLRLIEAKVRAGLHAAASTAFLREHPPKREALQRHVARCRVQEECSK